jgi:hypothetical protein
VEIEREQSEVNDQFAVKQQQHAAPLTLRVRKHDNPLIRRKRGRVGLTGRGVYHQFDSTTNAPRCLTGGGDEISPPRKRFAPTRNLFDRFLTPHIRRFDLFPL